MTNAEARFNKSLRPRKPEGSLGRTAQDVHLDSHTAPELYLVSAGVITKKKVIFQVSTVLWRHGCVTLQSTTLARCKICQFLVKFDRIVSNET